MSNPTQFNQGDIVRHYKSFYNSEEDNKNLKYYYKILCTEAYTAVDDPVRYVIYQALYGEKKIWLREYNEFMSEIDIEGNPLKYRFTKVNLDSFKLTSEFKLIGEINRNNRAYSQEAIDNAVKEYNKQDIINNFMKNKI